MLFLCSVVISTGPHRPFLSCTGSTCAAHGSSRVTRYTIHSSIPFSSPCYALRLVAPTALPRFVWSPLRGVLGLHLSYYLSTTTLPVGMVLYIMVTL